MTGKDLGISIKNQVKTKQNVLGVTTLSFHFGKTCVVLSRARPRSHTPWPRCVPDDHLQRSEVWKNLGFPFEIILLHSKSEFSWDEFENMDLGTHTWRSYENKHKNMDLIASFRIKTWFYLKNTRTSFYLSKTNFKSMYGAWIMLDHAMQSGQHQE